MPASQFFSMLSSRDALLQLIPGTRFINPGAMKGCFDLCAACKVNAAYAKTATQLHRVAVEGTLSHLARPLIRQGDASPTPPLFWTEIRAKVSPLLQLVTY